MMDIDEVRKRKKQAEKKIRAVVYAEVAAFQRDTGIAPRNITIDMSQVANLNSACTEFDYQINLEVGEQ